MPNTLRPICDDPDGMLAVANTNYGPGSIIRAQWAATVGGSYADVGTVPILAGVKDYQVFHAAGTSSTWYRFRFENAAGTNVSEWATTPADAPDTYASVAQFRAYLRTAAVDEDADDPDSDVQYLALASAARAIDVATNRNFGPPAAAVSARYFTYAPPHAADTPWSINAVDWYRHATLDIDDVFDTTGLTVAFDTSGNGDYGTAITTWRAGPANAPGRQMPYTRLVFDSGTYPPSVPDGVKVEALWGWRSVPPTITNANLIQAARFLKRRDAPFGVAGSPELGNELRLLSKLDPDVAVMVGAYKRNWGAV